MKCANNIYYSIACCVIDIVKRNESRVEIKKRVPAFAITEDLISYIPNVTCMKINNTVLYVLYTCQ